MTITVANGTDVTFADGTAIGPPVQFGPGGTQFSSPVTVTVPFDSSQLADNTLTVLERDDSTQALTLHGPVSVQATTVSVQTSAFSTYQAFAVPKPAITSFTADTQVFDAPGGVVNFTFAAPHAQGLSLSVSPSAGVHLPVLTATDTTARVVMPANRTPSGVGYQFTLTATGAPGAPAASSYVHVGVHGDPAVTFSKVVAGWAYFMGLTSDGYVYCWGQNSNGQCQMPAGLSMVSDLVAGPNYAIALHSNGTFDQWGNAGVTFIGTPSGNIAAVSAGESHVLGLTFNGTVVSWYADNGSGTAPPQAVVPQGLNNVIAVAAGSNFSLALKGDGTVVGWGSDGLGQISGATALTHITSISAGRVGATLLDSSGQVHYVGWDGFGAYPTPASSALANATAASAQYYTRCVLHSDGTATAWSNSVDAFSAPTGNTGFISIAAGRGFCVGLKPGGTIGYFNGNEGAGLPFASLGVKDAVQISINPEKSNLATDTDSHTLVLHSDGTVTSWVNWGSDSCGAAAIPHGLANVKQVAAGGQHSLALLNDGTVVAWGCGGAATVPQGLSGVTSIAAGGDSALALKADGTVTVWGDADAVSEWNPTTTIYPPPTAASCAQPCSTAVQPTNAIAVSSGSGNGGALLADGTISVWGLFFGIPATPPALAHVTGLSMAGLLGAALHADGTISIWGNNISQPGDLDPSTVTNAVAVVAGGSRNTASVDDPTSSGRWFALLQDGTVVGAGDNLFGQVKAAGSLTGVVQLTAGEHTAGALHFDGTVSQWGIMVVAGH